MPAGRRCPQGNAESIAVEDCNGEAIKYITIVDDDGQIRDFPPVRWLKGQEVEIKILPHANKKKTKLRHQRLRNKIKKKRNSYYDAS